MSPDDLIAAFTELAGVDPDLRINRTKVDDRDEIRLAAGRDGQAMHRFEALATDALALFAPVGAACARVRGAAMHRDLQSGQTHREVTSGSQAPTCQT